MRAAVGLREPMTTHKPYHHVVTRVLRRAFCPFHLAGTAYDRLPNIIAPRGNPIDRPHSLGSHLGIAWRRDRLAREPSIADRQTQAQRQIVATDRRERGAYRAADRGGPVPGLPPIRDAYCRRTCSERPRQ